MSYQRSCRICNTNWISKHKAAKYCSRKCAQKAYRKRVKREHPGYGGFREAVVRRQLSELGHGILACQWCGGSLGDKPRKNKIYCSDRCRKAFSRNERQADGFVKLTPLMRTRLKDTIANQSFQRKNFKYPGFKWVDRDKWDSIMKGNVHSLATSQVNELSNNYGGVLSALGLCSDLSH